MFDVLRVGEYAMRIEAKGLSGLVTTVNNRFFVELQTTAGACQIQLNVHITF